MYPSALGKAHMSAFGTLLHHWSHQKFRTQHVLVHAVQSPGLAAVPVHRPHQGKTLVPVFLLTEDNVILEPVVQVSPVGHVVQSITIGVELPVRLWPVALVCAHNRREAAHLSPSQKKFLCAFQPSDRCVAAYVAEADSVSAVCQRECSRNDGSDSVVT